MSYVILSAEKKQQTSLNSLFVSEQKKKRRTKKSDLIKQPFAINFPYHKNL